MTPDTPALADVPAGPAPDIGAPGVTQRPDLPRRTRFTDPVKTVERAQIGRAGEIGGGRCGRQ